MSKTMNKIISILIALVITGGGSFYAGMEYAKSKVGLQNLQNFSTEERQEMLQRMGANIGSGFSGGRFTEHAGEGIANGKIIAKDEESITIELLDGGSKIIFFSDSTEISKMTDGSIDDFEIGKQIMVTGEQNLDGSYTANTIQLSPSYQAPRDRE